ncbi:MAG: diguanylate cyclase [Bacilli bacterium]|nr:diguanylate cyclase [Bacilli bacterium]
MKQVVNNKNLKILVSLLFILVVGYICYVSINTNVEIDNKREDNHINEIKDYHYLEIESKDSPVGITRVYEWDLNSDSDYDNTISFYISHSYLKAYIDKELVYTINASSNITSTVGSHYIVIPITKNDNGKKVRLEITPVYKSLLDCKINIYEGSYKNIYINELKESLTQIIISYSGIALGLLLCITALIYYIKKKKTNELEYIGLFAIFIGIWRITDMKYTHLLYPNSSVLVSYLSLFSMFLAPVALNTYIKNKVSNSSRLLLNINTLMVLAYPVIIILLELFKISDVRNNLFIYHLTVIIYILLISFVVIKDTIKNRKLRTTNLLLIILFIGALVDVLIYIFMNSSNYSFSLLIALIFDVTLMAYETIKELHQQSSIDALTGLYNNNRCKEMINNPDKLTNDIVLAVIDLNGLKEVNDQKGHALGDKLIVDFSNILYKSISKDSFVGRWGGDEFIVISPNSDKTTFKEQISNLNRIIKNYNERSSDINISYSIGVTYSKDYDSTTMRDLFLKADKLMYVEKKKYHNK